MTATQQIILASSSRIRKALLAGAGVDFTTQTSDVDESALKRLANSASPAGLAINLAAAKSLAVNAGYPDALVIGADQILVFDGRIFDKPGSTSEARSQLQSLRNHTHQLISAISCSRNREIVWTHSSEAMLTMRDFSDAFLDRYIAGCGADLLTSVGGYKLEGPGIQLFREITGDYFTILGLPLLPLLDFLRLENLIAS